MKLFAFALVIACSDVLAPTVARAAQIDIHGPAGSSAFGTSVTALPNGNFVVTDPNGVVSNIGAVYLYSAGGALISTLTGSSANDYVGSDGVTVVGGSNFVVISSKWNNSTATQAGAVTWVNGITGLSGIVSASNSLVGTTTKDFVGDGGVTTLSNGNYVVVSHVWNNGVVPTIFFGAVTWGNGSSGIAGPVSASNSLIGTTAGDTVGGGGITALSNSNYVVASPNWNNGSSGSYFGAVTWGNGSSGITGPVSVSNSLFGTTVGDHVGYSGVTALSNGNYVVASSQWNNGGLSNHFGAATWGNGSSGTTGPISAGNSLVGTTFDDQVGLRVTALSNGNYVVASSNWNNGVANSNFGAVTWGNGITGITGPVSISNSLVGTTSKDMVGREGVATHGVTALNNGNYVVASSNWNNGTANSNFGAATWGNGSSGGITGPVSSINSLVGTTANDYVGNYGVTALSNGNYVVASPSWNNGSITHVGAATWGNGSSGIAGPVSVSNSLVGTTGTDQVAYPGVTALSNGNYVVASSSWNRIPGAQFGAATWGNGSSGITGPVSVSNSLFGTTVGDAVGYPGVTALSNGNYVVASTDWNNGALNNHFGAATWGNGSSAGVGGVSTSNSLFGTMINDQVGNRITALSDGNYVVENPGWNNGAVAATKAGAVTLASGAFRLKGTIQPWNSVLGMVANGGSGMTYSYDLARHRLLVGRLAENIVSLFTMDQIFSGDFEL